MLIDLDPQSHLTLHLGVEPGSTSLSMYDVMTGDTDLAAAVVRLGEHLWLAPAVIDLAAAEVELVGTVGREQILRDRLAAAASLPAELALIDCPPSLGLLTLNALAAADEVLIPLQPHFLALQGLGKLLETVSLVQHRINPRLKVLGVILCMYESKVRLCGEVVADLRQFLSAAQGSSTPWAQARIFQTVIRRNVKLAECPVLRQDDLRLRTLLPRCAGLPAPSGGVPRGGAFPVARGRVGRAGLGRRSRGPAAIPRGFLMALRIMPVLHRARRALLLVCIGAWVVAVVATHVPAPELSGLHVNDKTLHVVGFLGLASLFWLSLIAYGTRGWRRAVLVLGIMILYGALDEKTQGWFHRDPDVFDWLADVIGAVAAVIVWETIARLLHADAPRGQQAAPPIRYDQHPS